MTGPAGAARRDVTFHSSGKLCAGWLYAPAGGWGERNACIIMAHGLGGTRDAGLEPYARRFAAAGYAVLLFDYRHFGASEGQPRQLVSVRRQLEDWAAAVAFMRSMGEIDHERIGLWGSSFSGGHVLVTAARDGKIAAVSAQGPMMDGFAAVWNIVSYAGIGRALALTWAGLRDQAAALFGRPPVYVPLIAPPGQFAVMSSHDADSGYRAITPPGWRNSMAARLALTLALYRPRAYASRVKCPMLILACKTDSVAPASAALAAARLAGPKAELIEYDFGHFDIYVGSGFERSCGDALKFFERVMPARAE